MQPQTKQRLLALARSLQLLPLMEHVRFQRTKKHNAAENAAFLDAHPDFTAPPLWWMHDMYRHTSYAQYWRTGQETAAKLSAKIDQHLDVRTPRVADWGCGLSRVLRHLPDHYERTGFDYNTKAIGWCKENIANVSFHQNGVRPPLDAHANAFDALYALSVFTHLSAQGHDAWIAEIERVLAPGGIFLGAFHMQLPQGQLLPGEQRKFDAGELVVRGGVKEGSRIYTAHHPETYLRNHLLKNFDLVEPPLALFKQTLFIARRKSEG